MSGTPTVEDVEEYAGWCAEREALDQKKVRFLSGAGEDLSASELDLYHVLDGKIKAFHRRIDEMLAASGLGDE